MNPKDHIELIEALMDFYQEVIAYTGGANLYSVTRKGEPISNAGRAYSNAANRVKEALLKIHSED